MEADVGASWIPRTDDPDAVYDALTTWAAGQGLTLYPHQDEAVIELLGGSNVVLATPTGSGKSLVAVAAHAAALAGDRVSFYTAPIKALVSEKFFALCEIFGARNVGMLTGDASVNPDAPIICCTAEVLANIALREGTGSGRRTRRHGRVPLLRRSPARLGVAGAVARADPHPVRPDVGHARRRPGDRCGPEPPQRQGDGDRRRRRAAGAADLLVGDDAPLRDGHRARDDPPGAGLRRALHAGGSGGARHHAPRRLGPGSSSPGRPATRSTNGWSASASARASARPCTSSSGAASASTMPGCCRATAAWWSSWPKPACWWSSAAPTPSAWGSTCRSGPCSSPGSRSTTAPGSASCVRASSCRSPAAPAGPASTRRGTSSYRHLST